MERDVHALEMSRRELEIKRENLEERSVVELELDVADAYPDYVDEREAEGFEFTGTYHRGLSDAQNLAKVFVKYIDMWRF